MDLRGDFRTALLVRSSSPRSTADHYCPTLLCNHGRSLTLEDDVHQLCPCRPRRRSSYGRFGAVPSDGNKEPAATNWVNTTRLEATSLHHSHSLLIHTPSLVSLILRRRRVRRLRRLRRRARRTRRRRRIYRLHIRSLPRPR